MLKLEEYFHSLTGNDLLEFIRERLEKYKFFEGYSNIVVVIPISSLTGRWVAGRCGLLVMIEGFDEGYELNVIRHALLGLFSSFVELEFAIRGIYKVSNKSLEVDEYEFFNIGQGVQIREG